MWTDRLHLFLLNPIPWGVVTLVLAAIAFSGRVSVNLSNLLLFIAFIVGCFGIVRTGLKFHPTLILCFLLGAGLTCVSWWVECGKQQPHQVTASEIVQELLEKVPWLKESNQKKTEPQEKQFFVSLVNVITGGPHVAYRSVNDQLYYIEIIACIELVNKSNKLIKIDDYHGQLLVDSKWINLQHIPYSENGQFYWVSNIHGIMSIMFFQKTFDEQISGINIEPGKTITGIVMFYFKKEDRGKYDPVKATAIKLTIINSLKHKEEYIISLLHKPNKNENTPTANLDLFGYKIIDPNVDISKLKIVNEY